MLTNCRHADYIFGEHYTTTKETHEHQTRGTQALSVGTHLTYSSTDGPSKRECIEKEML